MIELAHYWPGMLTAYAILIVGSLSPGPSVAMLIGVGAGQGRPAALTATLGIAFGSATLNLLTLFGVSLLLREAAWAMQIVRIVGALYLLYLAYGALRRVRNPGLLQAAVVQRRSLPRHFLTGYLLQVTNPKAVSFWLAISAVNAVNGAAAWLIALFVLGGFIVSFTCHGAWAVAMSSNLARDGYARVRHWVEAALGGLFAFFAYRLLAGAE